MPAQAIVQPPPASRGASPRDRVSRASKALPGARGTARPEAEGRTPRPAGPGLGNDANTAATAGQSPAESRSVRYDARRKLQPLTGLQRVKKCGRVSAIEGGEVHLRLSERDGGAHRVGGFAGLTTCGSVWACPVCSAKIAAVRAQELEQVVRWNAERGGSVALLTLTMKHHKGMRLRTLRKGLTGAWRHVTSSRAWKETRANLGLDGYVRAIEATHGDAGWHLHIHALLLFDGPVSKELVELLEEELWTRWSEGLHREGLDALRGPGVDVRLGQGALDGLGKYLSKIVFEAVGGRWKKGRKGGRTPYEILGDFLASGNADDWDLWSEWETGSHGMRQLVWSRGLKDRAQVSEVTDEEAAEEDLGGELVAVLPARTWAEVWHEADKLLIALELGGPELAYRWLDRKRLAYETPWETTERAA